MKQIVRLYHTLKFLKLIQVFYQLWYRFLQYLSLNFPQKKVQLHIGSTDFFAYPFILPYARYFHPNRFVFLNLSKQFGDTINWEENEFGKLWNYNLQYLDYLNQQNIDPKTAISLIHSLSTEILSGRMLNEPYPASLRILNLIKFIHRTNEKNGLVLMFLNNQITYLRKHKEFHILGNHLLENAFALTAAALVTHNKQLFRESSQLLLAELNEQILPDGAHFERSVMYHAILFERLLDLLNMLQKIDFENSLQVKYVIEQKAQIMLGFLHQICFSNLEMPMFNDASSGISASINELIQYATTLGIQSEPIQLKDCGYRKLASANFEMIVDVEGIAPSYQPGHAHADSSSFICYLNQIPFLVETGTSTYQANNRRAIERASSSHNVVVINGVNSADVWGAFRVGKRPNVKLIKDESNEIVFTHDAYSNQGVKYLQRSFSLNQHLVIKDEVISIQQLNSCIAYFHFHPNIHPILIENENVIDTALATMKFEGASAIKLTQYEFAVAFNKTQLALKAEVHFHSNLTTTIAKKHA